jgi:6-phosphogluconolactonase
MTPEVLVFPDLDGAAAEAAKRFAAISEQTVAARRACAVALSGGDTPKTLFAQLAGEPYRRRIPWERLEVFWADERCVPPDDPQSNYKLAYDLLLSKVPVPRAQIYRMPGDMPHHVAAADAYAETLRAHLPATADGWPRFDFVLLGIGANAHTASLFPHTQAVRERERTVVAQFVEEVGTWRMTLTVPVLRRAADILFLASGASKAEAVRAALEGPPNGDDVPASLIRPIDGRVAWLLDRAAAARLGSAGGLAPKGFARVPPQ